MGFKDALEEITCVKVSFDQPMKKYTALGVGGNAKYFAEIDSLYSLNRLLSLTKEFKIKYKVIGNGTNVLISDKGFDGLIITTKKLSDIFYKRDQVKAMAGATIEKLLKFCLDNKLGGLEPLSGIPATVGGAIVMNAGAFGRTMSDNLTEVETLSNGKIKKYYKEECKFSYRSSRFLKSNEIVVSATFSLKESEREIILAGIKSYNDLRARIQPKGRSCGSVFKNPPKEYAGALIEKAGLKGFSIGGAEISSRHGNFIIASSTATAEDVRKLILHIKEKVNEKFGIILKEEVEYVGEF